MTRTPLLLLLAFTLACSPATPEKATTTAPAPTTATAAPVPAVDNGPEQLVQRLYAEHKPQFEQGMDLANQAKLSEYFTPELTALFIADDECVKRTQELCNLGFDPIFAAQDYDDNRESKLDLAVERVSESPVRVKATFTNLDRRSLTYELQQTPAGWRISDIAYPESPSLVAILKPQA